MKKILFLILMFFALYAFFWFNFFKTYSFDGKLSSIFAPQPEVSNNNRTQKTKKVLSLNTSVISVTPVRTENIQPESYRINILARKQAFNLSCEFAAAASIIYHYKNDISFSPEKEKEAEEILMAKIGVSDNPNIGIRMGKTTPLDEGALYQNLNERFGGEDYYGVHSPPFIDLFKEYGLAAKPLDKNNAKDAIRKAIYSGHLVMAWMNVGYGKPIDLSLSYGTIPVVRGEHSVVINGYDKDGLIFMDPGSGKERYIAYQNFLDAANFFTLPFLEVFPSDKYFSFDPSGPIDIPTNLNRKNLKVQIKNADKGIGAKSTIIGVLQDFGYQIIAIEDIDCSDCEKIKIEIKDEFRDYLDLLKKDLELAYYTIGNILTDLPASNSADAVITNGE